MKIRKTLCRECFNDRFKINLNRADCIYHPFIQQCGECGKMHHIIMDLRFNGKIKYMFRKRKKEKK